jgi:coenzyme F420 biosynthesis associated uncharacterized protein
MAMVDWDSAAAFGARLAPAGPDVSAAEAADAVAELAQVATEAVAPVRQTTGLHSDESRHRTVIVDREAWIRSNITGMQLVLESLERRVEAKRPDSRISSISAKASAVQVGGTLAWVSTKVLGQYEALTGPGQPGRLLLVAPNIVSTERLLDVPARDFRMWVALHEETHRVQFGANPWLEDHFKAEIDTFLAGMELTNSEAFKRLGAILMAAARVLGGSPDASLIDAAQTEAQKDVFNRLTAFMSLLEGHADYVMDAVGPQVVPSLDQIRTRFDHRRQNPSAGDGLLRRLMGMDAKLRQYTEGRAFVAGVVDRVGMAGFNRVWTSPQTLPTQSEIADPGSWVARVQP